MNFQAVEQGNGNLVQMFGTFTEIGGMQYTPQGKPKAICKIQDDAGIAHNVHIHQGNGQLPQPVQINQRGQFSLSTFKGNYQGKPYVGYSGFWNDGAQINQPTPQQAPRDTKPDWDGIAEGKVRTHLVGAAIQSGQIKAKTVQDIEYWTNYCMTGRAPLPPDKQDIPDY